VANSRQVSKRWNGSLVILALGVVGRRQPHLQGSAHASQGGGGDVIPISRSVPDSGRAAAMAPAMAPATLPSEISLIRAPVSRTCAISSAWRGPSRMHTVKSDTDDFFALATARTFARR
jgi:hypothetical protein